MLDSLSNHLGTLLQGLGLFPSRPTYLAQVVLLLSIRNGNCSIYSTLGKVLISSLMHQCNTFNQALLGLPYYLVLSYPLYHKTIHSSSLYTLAFSKKTLISTTTHYSDSFRGKPAILGSIGFSPLLRNLLKNLKLSRVRSSCQDTIPDSICCGVDRLASGFSLVTFAFTTCFRYGSFLRINLASLGYSQGHDSRGTLARLQILRYDKRPVPRQMIFVFAFRNFFRLLSVLELLFHALFTLIFSNSRNQFQKWPVDGLFSGSRYTPLLLFMGLLSCTGFLISPFSPTLSILNSYPLFLIVFSRRY